jgi:hypothetical protein
LEPESGAFLFHYAGYTPVTTGSADGFGECHYPERVSLFNFLKLHIREIRQEIISSYNSPAGINRNDFLGPSEQAAVVIGRFNYEGEGHAGHETAILDSD